MDKFFTQTTCDRCGGTLAKGRTMSMYSTECICMVCAEAERKRKDYARAREAERTHDFTSQKVRGERLRARARGRKSRRGGGRPQLQWRGLLKNANAPQGV